METQEIDEIYMDVDFLDPTNDDFDLPKHPILEITEQFIFYQISSQIARISTVVLSQQLNEYLMEFDLNSEKYHNAKIIRMKMDGSCLFRAIHHQLSFERPNTDIFEENIKLLRSIVVAHIKKNLQEYSFQIKNSVYDQNGLNDIKDMDPECIRFLEELEKPSSWGGSETMRAVSEIKRVNILIVNEENGFYYHSFEPRFARTIVVAYRLPQKNANKNARRNHYDSLTELKQEDIYL